MSNCPRCPTGTIAFRVGIAAKEAGTYSIAGTRPKMLMTPCLIAYCTNRDCDFTAAGHAENAQYNTETSTFTGGHFVTDPDLVFVDLTEKPHHRDEQSGNRGSGKPGQNIEHDDPDPSTQP